MSLIIITIVFWILFFINIIYEPRNFWNALILLFNIGMTMIILAMKPGINGKLLGIFVMLIPIIYFLVAILLILNGIQMIKRESKRLKNYLSLFTGIIMIIGSIFTFLGLYFFQDESILRSIFYLILSIELYILVSVIALFIYSLLYTYIPKCIDCDYIIVHGCGLKNGKKVSNILKNRVDKAVKIYNKSNGITKLVLSGGQGSDELISEAQAMKNYLIEINFPEKDIIMENKSTTTFENLKNVRDMLNDKNNKYIFVTNNYHVFRTSLFAKKLKMKAVGVGCSTARYYWPSAFIREYIAIMVKYKWTFGIILILWLLIEISIYI